MEMKKCIQCGREFTLTDSEIKFYKSKNFDLPKRCEECRKNNKQHKNGNSSAVKKQNNKNLSENFDGKKSKSGKNSKLYGLIALVIVVLISVIYPLLNNGDGKDTKNQYTQNANEYSYSTSYRFRNQKLLDEHYEKHGREMGFSSAAEYEAAAAKVINNPNAQTKTEKEDGDGVYFIESTGEFVILSTDGFIRTYYIADKDYFLRQQREMFLWMK